MKINPILMDVAKRSLATIQHFLYLKYGFIERNNSSIWDSIIMFKGSILNMSPVIFIIYIFVTKARFLFVLVLWNKDIHATRTDSTWDIQMNFSFGNQLRNKLYCKKDLQSYYWSSHYWFFLLLFLITDNNTQTNFQSKAALTALESGKELTDVVLLYFATGQSDMESQRWMQTTHCYLYRIFSEIWSKM